jgi:DNA-binding NarL/FixJ family response regulator
MTSQHALIVDDHPFMRKGLSLAFQTIPGVSVAATAEDAQEARHKVIEHPEINLALIDLKLGGVSGIDLVDDFSKRDINCLMITSAFNMHYIQRAIQAGAMGYMLKEDKNLEEAIRRIVVDRKRYFSEDIVHKMTDEGFNGSGVKSRLETLSNREFEIFQLIGQGLSAADIAEEMNVSKSTVHTHKSRMREKLNISDGSQLMKFAIRTIYGE